MISASFLHYQLRVVCDEAAPDLSTELLSDGRKPSNSGNMPLKKGVSQGLETLAKVQCVSDIIMENRCVTLELQFARDVCHATLM
jgi:hypothetical protein